VSVSFAYRAADVHGRTHRGRLAASGPEAAARELERLGLFPVEIRRAERDGSAANGFAFARRRGVLEIARAMAALLPAGMPVARALMAAEQAVSGPVAITLALVRARVERGVSLASALREHPNVFSPFFTGVIDAGEKSGDLPGAFDRLARHLEREEELRSRIISLSIYPALLLVVGAAATAVLILFVLPRFVELLDGAGAGLPRATAILVGTSAVLRDRWLVVVAFALAVSVALLAVRSNPKGRNTLARATISLPLVGALRRDAMAAAFARLVGGLLSGGAPLLTALDDARGCIADPLAQDESTRIRARIREGASLRQALSEGDLFPPLLGQLVAVGEDSGRLPAFLAQAATILERRTERTVERLVTLAEPAMIVLFGGVVGLVALALLQAVYGINAGTFR
jgi:type II secretory pathway component PulF